MTDLIMTPEEERWAEASTIYRMQGESARLWIAGRIGELALAGDKAGVERFAEIAAKLDAIMSAGEH